MKTLTLSILQFNTFVKNILDAEEFLSNVSVVGEVTNFKMSGGHAYFDLKEESAMLSCVKFGANDLNIKNGDLITVFGKINFYVKSGRLNFIVSRAQAYGLGELYQNFLLLKEKLEKEGLFREEIKKEIPRYAKRIGVVTSETGAVIRDIINVTKSKNPYTDILVYPSKVQGVGAEDELSAGIEYFICILARAESCAASAASAYTK
jgi:exodeoxyribonuclease VII large subunit